jgi:hypothetical protein
VLDVFRLKWFLPVLAVAVIVAVSLMAILPPKVTVNAQGTVAISNTAIPQFDIVSISDIPAYGIIEKSGCGEFKGKVKIRIDCFLTPDSPYYSQYGGAYVVDTASKEYLAGYKGAKDDKTGEPLDWDAYNKWLDGLPTVWQDNPFHSHFVYYDTTVLDDSIKAEIAKVTEYFYAFHTYCWDNSLEFIPQWQKVPKQVGTIRDVFIAGDSSPPNKSACELKATGIASRTAEFDTREFDKTPSTPTDLNIGDKGTIDIGAAATNRDGYYSGDTTYVGLANPANADGSLDTYKVWANASMTLFKPGAFYLISGTTYKCRDSEAIGNVTSGSEQTFTGLTIDVITGDYAGCYFYEGRIERDYSGGSGLYRYYGDSADPDDQVAYDLLSSVIDMSLYGTGTESGGAEITNTPDTWSIGTIDVNTAVCTAIDHFTIENTGTGAVDITIQGTDLDNGGSTAWDLADDGVSDTNVYGLWAGLDGDFAVYESYLAGYTGCFDAQDETWLAQTFTPDLSHRVTNVNLYLERTGSPGDLTVSIRNTSSDEPSGGDLCYETVDGDLLADSIEWVEFDMGAGYDLVAGTKYAIVIRCPSGSAANWILWGSDASATSTYAGGWHYESTNSGVDWTGITQFDFLFEEWGDDYPVAVPESSAATLVEDLAEDATQDWGMRMFMPSSITGYDGNAMTAVVTLVASAAS